MGRPKKIEGEIQTLTSEEVALMRKEISELREQVKSQRPEPFEEIRKASIKNQTGGQQITLKHFTDHRKVSLYHTNGFHIGKKIGPLHPGLLEQTFVNFKNKGIVLSVTCPTATEIEEYKKTDEYKQFAHSQNNNKLHRNKKISNTETEKVIAGFAKLIGVKPEEAIQLRPQEAVLK